MKSSVLGNGKRQSRTLEREEVGEGRLDKAEKGEGRKELRDREIVRVQRQTKMYRLHGIYPYTPAEIMELSSWKVL